MYLLTPWPSAKPTPIILVTCLFIRLSILVEAMWLASLTFLIKLEKNMSRTSKLSTKSAVPMSSTSTNAKFLVPESIQRTVVCTCHISQKKKKKGVQGILELLTVLSLSLFCSLTATNIKHRLVKLLTPFLIRFSVQKFSSFPFSPSIILRLFHLDNIETFKFR